MENELLWPRVWQMACRLDEIPNPGDFVAYEILDKSIIVVRVDDSTVKAYHNACRHRGVRLVEDRGSSPSGFICPFHGWCWGLDGANTFLYQPDLFDEANRTRPTWPCACPGRSWGGCAFINLDNHAPPLRESHRALRLHFQTPGRSEDLWPEWWLSCRCRRTGSSPWKRSWRATTYARPTRSCFRPAGANEMPHGYHATGRRTVATTAAAPPAPGRPGTSTPAAFIDADPLRCASLSDGMAGKTHKKDVRIAEGLRNLELPNEPVPAH